MILPDCRDVGVSARPVSPGWASGFHVSRSLRVAGHTCGHGEREVVAVWVATLRLRGVEGGELGPSQETLGELGDEGPNPVLGGGPQGLFGDAGVREPVIGYLPAVAVGLLLEHARCRRPRDLAVLTTLHRRQGA